MTFDGLRNTMPADGVRANKTDLNIFGDAKKEARLSTNHSGLM